MSANEDCATRCWARAHTFGSLLFVWAALWLAPCGAGEPRFEPLFDGKSLAGWRKAGGGATYAVEDGAIVGQVGPGANTFLCTEKVFGDFELRLEFKLDVPGNSGIQVRSHERARDGRVYGYQCEIDPSARAWTGGIYDEARRGWLFPLDKDPAARKALRADDWNRLVIRALGPSIKTWVNGVSCADLIDTMDLEGFIALQVHSGKQGKIRWRNIELLDLGRSRWRKLWDGKSFDGWETIGGGRWSSADGVLRGTSDQTETRHGHLVTKERYRDFAVRLQFLAKTGNSGFYFRVAKTGTLGIEGLQADIDPKENTGGVYETGGRAWVLQPTAEQVKKYFRPGQWNEMAVVAVGRRIVVQVNGQTSVELRDDPGRTEGHLALQLHGGQDMDVRFKEIEVLDSPTWAKADP